MPWNLSELSSKRKALLYALIDIRVDNAKNIARSKE